MAAPVLRGCTRTATLPSFFTTAFRSLSLTPTRKFSGSQFRQTTAKLPSGIPPYPYGPRRSFKQADSGLYGRSTIQFGNKISKGRNKGKTRRIWKPNIRKEKLYSETLDEWLDLKVQHRVLRTIRKVGGLDAYLLGDKPARIKELGIFGWRLRWRVMMSNAMQKKFEKQREQLGLEDVETFESFWARHTAEQQLQAAIADQAEMNSEMRSGKRGETSTSENTSEAELESAEHVSTEQAIPASTPS